MHINARLYPLRNKGEKILARLLPTESLKTTSARYPVNINDSVFAKIIQAGDKAGGFWVSAESILSAAERRTISHFELACRKVVQESEKDYEHNFNVFDQLPFCNPDSSEPVKLSSGYALSKINLKPNMVGAIGDWTSEYVLGSAVTDAFQREGLSGWSSKPVINFKTQSPYSDFLQLYCENVLGPANLDCSIELIKSRHPEEIGRRRLLGYLSYQADYLNEQADFFRSAEAWAGWTGWPAWIVSSRVADVFRKNKLRGWTFRPVLTIEDKLYSEYISQWHVLNEVVTNSTKSQFDGGCW